MFLLSVWLYSRFGPHDDFASIDYDEFVKEFLLPHRATSISVSYSGRVTVEIQKGGAACGR